MEGFDLLAASQIGDGAGQFEDAGKAASRETELVGDLFEQFIALLIQLAEAPDVPGLHLVMLACRPKWVKRSRWIWRARLTRWRISALLSAGL